ncbi:MAG: hypothetical protein GXP25_16290 [Planctomycetes bacterium]|nr:hypothetical protein [Planctomycetota bacterium]
MEVDGRSAGAAGGFAEVVAGLWEERTVRDESPWAIGWMGYEAAARHAGGLPSRPEESGLPSGYWLIEPRRLENPPAAAAGRAAPGAQVTSGLSDREFADGVREIRRRIAAGEIYLANLTRRFRIHPWSGGLGPLLAPAAAGSSPPYLAWATFEGGELVCASMELLLRRRGDRVETWPIKGTRPRGANAAEDERLAAELDADPKEKAELAMVVDLERNDLGRLAVPGSVRVVDSGSVRRYAVVQHRVARVCARVNRSLPWWELLRAVAPGGSVTGCPKWVAMEIIAGLEAGPRGPYTGILGVVCGNGDLELALPIRTAWRSATPSSSPQAVESSGTRCPNARSSNRASRCSRRRSGSSTGKRSRRCPVRDCKRRAHGDAGRQPVCALRRRACDAPGPGGLPAGRHARVARGPGPDPGSRRPGAHAAERPACRRRRSLGDQRAHRRAPGGGGRRT